VFGTVSQGLKWAKEQTLLVAPRLCSVCGYNEYSKSCFSRFLLFLSACAAHAGAHRAFPGRLGLGRVLRLRRVLVSLKKKKQTQKTKLKEKKTKISGCAGPPWQRGRALSTAGRPLAELRRPREPR
jgi:hypothetical protein